MNTPESSTPQPVETNAPAQSASYEPPCIESVLTSEEIEREVQYAGVIGSGGIL